MIRLRKCNSLTGVFYMQKKVLKFPSMETFITDDDIEDLFFGLLELVKKNTELKVEQKYKNLINVLKNELRECRDNN